MIAAVAVCVLALLVIGYALRQFYLGAKKVIEDPDSADLFDGK